MNWRLWTGVGALLCASWVHATSDCLIVQFQEPNVGESNPNYTLAPYVAEELDKDGRVRPVVWSMTDPVFREWTSKDVFRGFEFNPTLNTVQDVARKLGVKYVLTVRGFRAEQQIYAIGELYVNGRSAWRFGPRKSAKGQEIVIQSDGRYDEKATRAFQAKVPDLVKAGGTFAVFQNGVPDFIETARSVARTWSALLGEGPLKSLPSKPRLEPTDAGPGAGIDNPDLTGPVGAESQDVLVEARALASSGNFHRALLLLREACDRRPFDVAVRKELVSTLILAGMPDAAADAAQVATQLNPDDPEILLLAAKSWIGSSEQDKAGQALEAAIAKGATGDTVVEIQGELALLQGDAKLAMTKFSTLKGNRSTLRRAIALALTGDSAGCVKAVKDLGAAPLTEDDYRTLVLFVERSLLKLGDQSRAVLPSIRIHPGEPQTLAQAGEFSDLANAMSALVAALVPPVVHKESHEARKLAHILLAQASLEALGFAKNNDPELAEEAAATLGQAFKLFPGVREKFALERKYGGA